MMDNHTKKLKKHFDSASRGAFPPPTDIKFIVYSKNIWLNFLSAVKQKNNPLIVDFGCGGGTGLFCLEKEGFNNLQGVDLCPNIPANFLKYTKFREEDALKCSFEDNCVDAVVSTMFIEHVDDVKFVTEIYRVLKPGGIALVTSVLKKKWAWYFYKNEKGAVPFLPCRS
jgi:ubiquinone/menaquinone biosynthesis C-methylase UbiE